jgi:hypothetical protein
MIAITPELQPQWERLATKAEAELHPLDVQQISKNQWKVLGSKQREYTVRFGHTETSTVAECSCEAYGLCKHIVFCGMLLRAGAFSKLKKAS